MRKRKRKKRPRPLDRSFMDERFPISIPPLEASAVNYVPYTASSHIQLPGSSKWQVISTTLYPPVIDPLHGLYWFTLPWGKIETIGFVIHHDLRRDGGARAEAYLRLVPTSWRVNEAYESKGEIIQAHKRQKVQRPRESRQIIGRSHRRF